MKNTKESLTGIVLKNSLFSFLQLFIGRLGSLLFTLILARIFLPEIFGLYSLAFAIITTLAILADGGIGETTVKYLAESLKKTNLENKRKVHSRFIYFLKIKVIFALFMAIILFVLSDQIAIIIFKKPEIALFLKIGAAYIISLSIKNTLTSVLIALKNIKWSAVADLIMEFGRLLLLIIAMMFYRKIEIVFVIFFLSSLFSISFLYLCIKHNYPYILKEKNIPLDKKEKKLFWRSTIWLSLVSLVIILFLNIDTFMLSLFLPAEFVGYYRAISTIVLTICAVVSIGNNTLFPIFKQINLKKTQIASRSIFRYLLMISIPVAVGSAVLLTNAIKIIFGSRYVPQEHTISITIAGILLSLLIIEIPMSSLYTYLLNAKEQLKDLAKKISLSLVLSIILNYVLLTIALKISISYGLIAVSLAMVISRYYNLFVLSKIAKDKLKVKIEKNSLLKPMISAVFMLLFILIYKFFIPINVITGLIVVGISAIVYFISLFIIKGIKKEDLVLIKLIKF